MKLSPIAKALRKLIHAEPTPAEESAPAPG
jgi:hypothetical protein